MLDSIAFIIGTTLMYSTPLLYTALGGTISENSGVINLGLEGMMTMGAFIGAAVGFLAGSAWIGFFAAGIAGLLLALLHGLACIVFKADQTVAGIAMNFVGPGLALFLSRMIFKGTTETPPLSLDTKIPRPLNGVFPQDSFFDIVFNQYWTVFIAFALVYVMWFLLYRTQLGLRVRACGEHPRAADTMGINVALVQFIAVGMSGLLAGFGGAAMSVAVVANFRPTLISGQGFIALAAMIFGKWMPQGAMWACLLFGAAQGLVIFLGRSDIHAVLPIPSEILSMIPFVLTLIILVTFVGRAVAPTSDGIPYDKESE
ncbi:MAG TPA: ABC transporter permease [Spirochaetia bacterium]